MKTELWSDKSLNLLWQPASRLWHSPMLLRSSGWGWKWYWRVDVTFGAWAVRTLSKARSAGAFLTGEPEKGLEVIRWYLDESDPGSWPRVETLAGSPVRLPGDELISTAAEFARWGWVPLAG